MSRLLSVLERAETKKRITPVSILGIILVPLVVAGLLVWSLWNPQERLGEATAAIVNNDQSIELDGQTVLLGRQLSAGLVDSGTDTNYTWVITNATDAKDGLSTGRYTAVVTIPKNFSAAATSFSGKAADAERARIDVVASRDSTIVEDAITTTITTTASAVLGRQLTTTYLDNVYLGFNTLGDQLGQAADGAQRLSAGGLSLAQAANQLAQGTTSLSGGASDLSSGARQLSNGTSQLSNGLGALNAGVAGDGGANPGLVAGAAGLASGTAGITGGIEQNRDALVPQGDALNQLVADCIPPVTDPTFCDRLTTAANAVTGIGGGLADLATGAAQVSGGAAQFSAGIPPVASGLAQLAGASSQLANGAAQLSGGASDLSSGTAQLADGATQLAGGAGTLTGGISSLSAGLRTAVDELPSYSSTDRRNLADVVAEPLSADNPAISSAADSTPLYATLALWLGALASLLVLRAVPVRTFGSTRSSLRLALGSFAPAAALGVLQGLLVAAVLAPILGLDTGRWLLFAGTAALAGVAFSAVNQALVAVLGGAGRFVVMIVALVGLGTGIVVTASPVLDQLTGILPLGPAIAGLRAILTGEAGALGAATGLVFWLAASLAVTTAAVARRRTTSVRQLVAVTPTMP